MQNLENKTLEQLKAKWRAICKEIENKGSNIVFMSPERREKFYNQIREQEIKTAIAYSDASTYPIYLSN